MFRSLTLLLGSALVLSHSLLFATDFDMTKGLVGDGETTIPLVVLDTFMRKQPVNGQKILLQDEGQLNEIVSRFFYDRLLADDARKKGYDKDPVYKARLAGVIDRELAMISREEMFKEPVPELNEVVEEYYSSHPDEFSYPEMVRVAHIMIGYKLHDVTEARKIAEEVREALLKGEDFTPLAEAKSEDPSVKNNKGDLDWHKHSDFVEPFAIAAFALEKKGELSEVIQTNFGFHVIKLLDKKPPQLVPFEEIKSKLTAKLVEKYKQDRWLEYVNKTRKEHEVSIDSELLESYRKDRLEIVAPGASTEQPEEPKEPKEPKE
jgi:parvulin-like peptidyl-prolyl isomerase